MRLQRFIAEVRAGKRQLSDSPEPHSGVPFQAHMAVSGGGSGSGAGAGAGGFAASAGFGPSASSGSSLAHGTARSSGAASAAAAATAITGIAAGGTYGGVRSEEEVARATADAAHAAEKDRRIAELEDWVDILTQKVSKLEQLVRLKDTRIGALSARLVRE